VLALGHNAANFTGAYPMKRLLLVDGSSYLYRAFHAMPDLRDKSGEPTGAIHGMVAMLRKLKSEYPADFTACVFDAKGRTFRDDLYDQYKAQRSPMPEDLVRQIAPIHEAVRALGWPILEVAGIEADDVIATLATQASARGYETVISTGDKDLAQLVDEQVRLVNTMSGEVLDRAGVIAKFGVPPERIVDYLALIGDSVDNVPGVDKVGPKTAAKWLGEHGTLDAIIAGADKFGGATGENLRRALPMFPLTRTLLTVKRDCDLAGQVASIEDSLAATRGGIGQDRGGTACRGRAGCAGRHRGARAGTGGICRWCGRADRTALRVRADPSAVRGLDRAHRSGATHMCRYRDHVARPDAGAHRGVEPVDRGRRGLLCAARASLSGCAGAA
jgi:5'-3' exonuclease